MPCRKVDMTPRTEIEPETTSPRPLRVSPVTKAGFEPFGWLVETGDSGRAANNGTARRHDLHAHPAADVQPGSRFVTSIFEAKPQQPTAAITMLERHVNSVQLIMPLGGAGHIVIVSQSNPDGTPDLSTLAAFAFSAAQGMIYRRGLWHHPIMAIGAEARFLVQSWQNGTEADCEILAIEARTLAPMA
ncbi:MAG: ureidoglycolate hydrolase [Hyphomicrobiales bacterium]|nr:MAG: ureidoglycolate hydrolase [Hyphomicrobiales bacterium]